MVAGLSQASLMCSRMKAFFGYIYAPSHAPSMLFLLPPLTHLPSANFTLPVPLSLTFLLSLATFTQ